jgi:hypothetical protein
VETPVVETAVAAPRVTRLRKPLAEARAHNMVFAPLANGDKPQAANVAGTTKGTNPTKQRVYGYDNLANGGGVPKDKRVVVVTEECPKSVNADQYAKLVAAVKADPAQTVAQLKGAGIAGKTIRRAYRMGGIRFAA